MTQLPSRFRRADRTQDGADAQPAQRRPRIGLGHLLLFLAVVALVAVNAATLLSDRAHAWAYSIVAPVARAVCGPSCLEDSPTEGRKREVEAAVQEAEKRYAALQARTLALVATTGALIAATDLTVSTTRNLVTRARALAGSHAALGRAHATLTESNNNLARAYQRLKNVARGTANRVAGRLYKGSTRKVASMAGQAIPIVGTTLVWGLTAVDVYDACDAMKDLAALDAELADGKAVDLGAVCGIKIPSVAQVNEMVVSGWRTAYQSAADLINGEGRVTVPADAGRPSDTQARGFWCRIFGC